MATVRPAPFSPASLYADWICAGPNPTGPFMIAGPRPLAETALAKQVTPRPRAAGSNELDVWFAGLAQPASSARPTTRPRLNGVACAWGSARPATVSDATARASGTIHRLASDDLRVVSTGH